MVVVVGNLMSLNTVCWDYQYVTSLVVICQIVIHA